MSYKRIYLFTQGGTTHSAPYTELEALQVLVGDEGAAQFPLFLRLGGSPETVFQPVTARALLAEVERFEPRLKYRLVPGVRLTDVAGEELGHLYGRGENRIIGKSPDTVLSVDPNGIRLRLTQFPPPAGFRSNPAGRAGVFQCYFARMRRKGDQWEGFRTEEMGGPAVPVALPPFPLPPVTRWDVARVAGKPEVAELTYVEHAATDIYRDLIHAVTTACTEAMRHKTVLRIRRDV